MPWNDRDAKRHTRAANTPKRARQWRKVANSAIGRGHSDASAIRMANAVVKRSSRRKTRRNRRS